jgi:hypothetical protein
MVVWVDSCARFKSLLGRHTASFLFTLFLRWDDGET